MATLAVGCGSSSSDDTVGVEDNTETTDTTDTTDTETLVEDMYSLDSTWANNSLLSEGGQHGNSSYTKGVQRILFCLGYHPENQTSINGFADGIFGPNTKAAVEDFQAEPALGDIIAVDGIIGPETWGKLQDIVELDQPVDVGNGYESRSIQTANNKCGTEAQFYQNVSDPYDWKMAKTPGSTVMVQFSINGPNQD